MTFYIRPHRAKRKRLIGFIQRIGKRGRSEYRAIHEHSPFCKVLSRPRRLVVLAKPSILSVTRIFFHGVSLRLN